LGVGVAAHPINRARGASSYGIGVAARMLCGDGYWAIRATDDGSVVIEGVFAAKIDDKARVPRTAFEDDVCADFNAKRFIGFGVGKVGRRGRVITATAFDLHSARSRYRTAGICCGTNTGGIRSRADVPFNFLLGFIAGNETSLKHYKGEQQTTKHSEIGENLHYRAPHAKNINAFGKRLHWAGSTRKEPAPNAQTLLL